VLKHKKQKKKKPQTTKQKKKKKNKTGRIGRKRGSSVQEKKPGGGLVKQGEGYCYVPSRASGKGPKGFNFNT